MSRVHYLSAFSVVFLASTALAGAPEARTARAQQAYDELRFEDVLREVAAVRERGNLTRQETVELLRLEAYTHSAFDDRVHAVQAFRDLMLLEPGLRLPAGISPKIQRYYEEARQSLPPPVLAPSPPAHAPSVDITAPPPPPSRSRGWLWGGLSVVAVGAVVAVFLLTRPEQPKGDLGTLKLP